MADVTPVSAIDLTVKPYYNRFKAEQNRTMVLYQPDRVLQSAELIEAQSVSSYYLGALGDSLMHDGDIQSGMSWTADGLKRTVKSGKVYLAGKVRNFTEQTVTLTGAGMEEIGVRLSQAIVDSTDDPTLLDQAESDAQMAVGADRLVETVKLVANDSSAATIFQFKDGDLYIANTNNQLSQINSILAKRTNDESGSYGVSGFGMSGQKSPSDPANYVQLIIESGLAYIKGYSVEKPVTSRINLPKSLTANNIEETAVYDATTQSITLGQLKPKQINHVLATVRVTGEVVQHAAVKDSTDSLTKDTVIKIERVWTEGANAHEYVAGTDYNLSNHEGISWAPSAGQEPAVNSSYKVTYTYTKPMTSGKDFVLQKQNEGKDAEAWILSWSGQAGDKPIDQTDITVGYDYYLFRKDLVTLDQNGTFTIHQGQPNRQRFVQSPNLVDPDTLQVGTVLVYPNSDTLVCNLTMIMRMTMQDLQHVQTRVGNLEYNQSINQLDSKATTNVDPTLLRGVFSDGFISMDKYDGSYPDADIQFSFEDGEITLPWAAQNEVKPTLNVSNSTIATWGRLVSADFTETKAISQPNATEAISVNEFTYFNHEGVLKLTPSADNWVDQNNVTVTSNKTKTLNIGRWWIHGGTPTGGTAEDNWYAKYVQWDQSSLDIIDDAKFDANGNRIESTINWTNKLQGTVMSSGGQKITDEQVQYIRVKDVAFSASGLGANANDLVLHFDGILVPVVPAAGFNKGSASGSIMADSNGNAKGTFTIPSNVKTGTREVTLSNGANSCITTYVAEGINRTVTDTIIQTHVTAHLTDPLAQSFQFQESRIITSIGVYFGSKDATASVKVQVRGISDGGNPSKTVYAERILMPSDVKTSADGSVETKVSFDDPLMATAGQSYCVMVISGSENYTLWTSTLGQPLINDRNTIVNFKSYTTGAFYSSSNGEAWTPEQTREMKFNVYTATFNPTGTMQFDPMINLGLDTMLLLSTYLTPNNTGCLWEYRAVSESEDATVKIDTKTWFPLANFEAEDAEAVYRIVQLRATFRTNDYVSPLLSLDDLSFGSFITALNGSYVSRGVDLTDAPYNTLKVSYNQHLPKTAKIVPQYSVDAGATWKNFKSAAVITRYDSNYDNVSYTEHVTGSGENGLATAFKIRLNMSTQSAFLRPRAKRLLCSMTNI